MWNLETDARLAWAHLVVQNLVRDEEGDRDSFLRLVREEVGREEITGGPLASRVGYALRKIEIVVGDSWSWPRRGLRAFGERRSR